MFTPMAELTSLTLRIETGVLTIEMEKTRKNGYCKLYSGASNSILSSSSTPTIANTSVFSEA